MEVMEPAVLCDMNAPNGCTSSIVEPNEQILRLMAGLGIDSQKTRESLKVNTVRMILYMMIHVVNKIRPDK